MSARDARVDALYGLPLDRFVAERDTLAKALRADGDRAAADDVRKLAKPTRAAWAVNVAVREHPDAARALAEAARLLAQAQQELLAGGRASVLREASESARAAVDALVALAPASGDATADKVRATLHAATVDPDVLAMVAAGRAVRERVASGFGAMAELAAVGGRRQSRRRVRGEEDDASAVARDARPREARKAGAREERARNERAREDARRREKLRRAKEFEASAEHDLAAARRALEQVESALAERRAQLRDAEARLKDARRRRERAER